MDTSLEHLRRLLDKLKTISFWERFFYWGKIRNMLLEAYGDLQRIAPTVEGLRSSGEKAESQLGVERNETKNLHQNQLPRPRPYPRAALGLLLFIVERKVK